MTLRDDGFDDGGPATAVTERCVMCDEGDWFTLSGDLKFLCPDLLSWFSSRDGRLCRLAVCWCIKSVGTRYRTKLQHDATCVVLRHRWQNRALSADVVEEGADGSLVLESVPWVA